MATDKVKEKTPGSGRKAGTPNKKTEALMEICERNNFNPFEALVDMAKNGKDDGLKLGALKELCQYLYPKRKALEVSNPDGQEAFVVKVVDYRSK